MKLLDTTRFNTRPRAAAACEWRWPQPDAPRVEFLGIVDVAMRFIAAPPPLRRYLGGFPHRNDRDNVLTGAKGALSQHVIFGLAQTLGFESYLEVGTRYGYSIGAVMAASRRLRHGVTIDPFVDADRILANLASLNRPEVKVEMSTVASRDFDTDERFDAVYVDGDHTYEAAFGDIKQYWTYVRPGGLLFVDDTINNRGDYIEPRERLGVLWAVKDFLCDVEDVAAAVLKLPTYSGIAVIQKAY